MCSGSELALITGKECSELIQSAIEYARKPQVDTVVIGFCWYAYFIQILDTNMSAKAVHSCRETDRALESVRRMITGFVKEGKRVYLVLQLPVDPGFAPMQMVKRTVLSPGFRINARPAARAALERTFDPFISKLVRIARDAGANVIDPMNYVCDSTTCSPLAPTGQPMYHDTLALTYGLYPEARRISGRNGIERRLWVPTLFHKSPVRRIVEPHLIPKNLDIQYRPNGV